MQFSLSEDLLQALHAHREARRTEIATRFAERKPRRSKFRDWVMRAFQSRSKASVTLAANEAVDSLYTFEQEVDEMYDAFLLDPGMGPMAYLTSEGRVLLDFRSWDGDDIREATEDEAIMALVVGAQKTQIAALLDLLPPRPAGAKTCEICKGSRWISPFKNNTDSIVCPECSGRGWVHDEDAA